MGGLLLILSGCASTGAGNSAPASALAEKPVPPRSGAPVNTGAYPNINIVPEGVTTQLTDADASSLRSTLYAEQAAQRQPGEPVEAYIARLRKLQQLGSTHAAAALKEIAAAK
jgi:hypothetical protein